MPKKKQAARKRPSSSRLLRRMFKVYCDTARRIRFLEMAQTRTPPLDRNEITMTLSASLLLGSRVTERAIASQLAEHAAQRIMGILHEKYFQDAIRDGSSCGSRFVVNIECVPH